MKTDPEDVLNSVVRTGSIFRNPFLRSLGQTYIKTYIITLHRYTHRFIFKLLSGYLEKKSLGNRYDLPIIIYSSIQAELILRYYITDFGCFFK